MLDIVDQIVWIIEAILGFMQLMFQFLIDFVQIPFGMGAYADLAPPSYLVIFIILVYATGYRIIDDLNLYIENVAEALINPSKLDKTIDRLADRLARSRKKK